MDSVELRQKFVDFYKQKKHIHLASVPLVPENDPTTLFTGAGMQPMLPYLLGERHPLGTRFVNSQICIRASGFNDDILEVGDSSHTTFFEMLGNWSLGDYFKKEQLTWIFEFLVDVVGLDPKKLYVSVYGGNSEFGLERDSTAADLWVDLFAKKGISAGVVDATSGAGRKVGINDGRIFYYGDSENWWSRSGPPQNMPVGEPGGGDSEIYYDFGPEFDLSPDGPENNPNPGDCDGRFLELCNSVFMEYVKASPTQFEPLPQKNIDFGGGLARILAASKNDPDIFKTDLYSGIIGAVEEVTSSDYESQHKTALRIIADHITAAVFLIRENVEPSNKQQGYVLRKMIRRAVMKLKGIKGDFSGSVLDEISPIIDSVVSTYSQIHNDFGFSLNEKNVERALEVIKKEVYKFEQGLEKGIREFNKLAPEDVDAKFAFNLYQTYGFPYEITSDLLKEKGVNLSHEDFKREFESHQKASKSTEKDIFKGGLADQSEKTVWYHTVTHLMHQALFDVLGVHVKQEGSNITPERLRFDFKHSEPLTQTQISEIEDIVNSKIVEGLPVSVREMPLEEAQRIGAKAFFKEKYAPVVKVYSIGDYSTEICGGPHVNNTNEIKGTFKIVKEKSNGSGIRRIRAVLE